MRTSSHNDVAPEPAAAAAETTATDNEGSGWHTDTIDDIMS